MNIVSFFLQCSLLIYAPILFVANDAAEWADCVISRLAQRNSGHTKVGFSPLKPLVRAFVNFKFQKYQIISLIFSLFVARLLQLQ